MTREATTKVPTRGRAALARSHPDNLPRDTTTSSMPIRRNPSTAALATVGTTTGMAPRITTRTRMRLTMPTRTSSRRRTTRRSPTPRRAF